MMADQIKIETIDVSSLQDLPVRTKNISGKMIKIATDIAKSNPDDIKPILVGRVNDLLYPINEFETVSGLIKAKVKTTSAIITDYPTMEDLIIGHVRKNFEPHMIDPLRIREVIQYMAKNSKMNKSDICKALWLDRRPDLFASVHYEITDETRDVLSEMVEEISKKVYSIVTPVYYIERLSKISELKRVKPISESDSDSTEKQEQNLRSYQTYAALEIKSIAMAEMMSEDRYLWPSAETIKTVLRPYPRKQKEPTVEERIAAESHIGDLNKKKKEKNVPKKSAKIVKKAENFIKNDPNLIYVPLEGEDSDLVINKKTGRVAKAKEVDGLCSISGDLGKSTQILPFDMIDFFNIEDVDQIHTYKFTTLEKAQNSLAKSKTPEQKCIVLTLATLPRK